MYNAFFNLTRDPFAMTPDPGFLYLTSGHREALAGLLFAINSKKGFLVLTGDAGTGKTTLLRTMFRRFPAERAAFSFLVNPTLSPAEFLEYVLLNFGLADLPPSKAQRLIRFRSFLIRLRSEGKTPVLVLDEAHKLSPDLLEEIRLLSNFETADEKLLQIILAGQTELAALLDRDDLRQLKQRIAVRISIHPLAPEEIGEYLQTRWERAGGQDAQPFSEDAIAAIAHCSRGIPRVVNSICDNALINAFAMEERTVTALQISEVAHDLALSSFEMPNLAPPPQARVPASTLVQEPLSRPVSTPAETIRVFERPEPAPAKRPLLLQWANRLGMGKA